MRRVSLEYYATSLTMRFHITISDDRCILNTDARDVLVAMLLRCHRLADYEADALASGGLYSAAQIAGTVATRD